MKLTIYFSIFLIFFCCSEQTYEPVDIVNKAIESIVNMDYDKLLELYDSSSQNIIKSRIGKLNKKNKITNSDNYKSINIIGKEIINKNPKKIKFTLEHVSKEQSFFYTIKVGDSWFLTL
jgi:hypothetical protein